MRGTLSSFVMLAALAFATAAAPKTPTSGATAATTPAMAAPTPAGLDTATFAMGCFWCGESQFTKQPGVRSVTSGYTGGHKLHPTYEEVSSGTTGHYESVRVIYDPAKTSYESLLDMFWHGVDPTQADGQFCDHGSQYRTAIFFHGTEQKRAAEESKKRVEEKLKTKVATGIVAAGIFYPAEAHHQDYARRNPAQYDLYRKGCGRDELLKQIWGVAPREQPKESHP